MCAFCKVICNLEPVSFNWHLLILNVCLFSFELFMGIPILEYFTGHPFQKERLWFCDKCFETYNKIFANKNTKSTVN